MTLQELIELAILDAMGLLDEEERIAFELAFRASAPAVQSQVRREQTRLSRIEHILPEVTPPAGLRAAVVEAVRREMASAEGKNPALMLANSMVRPRGVSRVWRAASLGLAAAVVALGVTTISLKSTYGQLKIRLQNDTILEAVNRELGPSFVRNVLFSKDTRRIILSPTQKDSKGVASVWVNGESGFFFCQAMKSPKDREFKIAIVDSNNKVVRELATFRSDGELIPVPLKNLNGNDRGRLAVGTPSADGKLDPIAEADLGESSL